LVQAAERMEVSYRQAKRLWKRYRAQGPRGWCMGTRAGVEPSEAEEFAAASVGAGAEEVWRRGGERFGPTLAAEHLAEEDGIELG